MKSWDDFQLRIATFVARFRSLYRRWRDNRHQFALGFTLLGQISWSAGTSATRISRHFRPGFNTNVMKICSIRLHFFCWPKWMNQKLLWLTMPFSDIRSVPSCLTWKHLSRRRWDLTVPCPGCGAIPLKMQRTRWFILMMGKHHSSSSTSSLSTRENWLTDWRTETFISIHLVVVVWNRITKYRKARGSYSTFGPWVITNRSGKTCGNSSRKDS